MEEQKFQERRKVKDNNQQSENSLACARGMTYAYGDTCVSSKCLSDHACAHGRARRPFTRAEIAAWRERIFADASKFPLLSDHGVGARQIRRGGWGKAACAARPPYRGRCVAEAGLVRVATMSMKLKAKSSQAA